MNDSHIQLWRIKMLKHFAVIALTFAAPSTAFASHYDRCEFTTEVVAVTSLMKLNESVVSSPESRPATVVALKVIEAKQFEGHGTCSGRVDTVGILEVDLTNEPLREKLQLGATVKIEFNTMGGRAPQGFWDRTSWTLID
jgi:hypothetical protein